MRVYILGRLAATAACTIPRRFALTGLGLCSIRVYCLQVYLHEQGPALSSEEFMALAIERSIHKETAIERRLRVVLYGKDEPMGTETQIHPGVHPAPCNLLHHSVAHRTCIWPLYQCWWQDSLYRRDRSLDVWRIRPPPSPIIGRHEPSKASIRVSLSPSILSIWQGLSFRSETCANFPRRLSQRHCRLSEAARVF